ncbi:Beta sliding clamp [Candidatus Desulfarcum epimagneticum]|uniref:Beta sliding clamp n=1 Tax=uncultured Desulfobacteraceae bacterium TaxID=218296 RepID=A0A484HC27_9BACT|nr:Beta sliding clamp [uncultured Desulfobacteraceae bacterium]
MKFKIKKDILSSAIFKIQGITSRKSSLSITENALIHAAGSNVIIQATDTETGFEGVYPAEVEIEGSMVLDSKKLFEIVKDFPVDDIGFNELDNRWIRIGNDQVHYSLAGQDPEEFPLAPEIEKIEFFEIKSSFLRDMIEKSVVIGPRDDNRPHMDGILFSHLNQDGAAALRMVSTDGTRMSKADYRFGEDETPPYDFAPVIIPKRGLSDALKFLKDQGPAHAGVKDNHAVFKNENEKIVIRLLQGDFPDFDSVIQVKENLKKVKIRKEPFLMMLKRMSIFSNSKYRSVFFQFKDGLFSIENTNPEIGESREDTPIEFEGDPVQIAFNPRYFIDTINVMRSRDVYLNIADDKNPCVIEGDEDIDYLSVIMPMKV